MPGDALPLATFELERVLETTSAMHDLTYGGALGAMGAAIDRAVPRGLLAGPYAVFDLGDDGATDGAMRADILPDLDRGARLGAARLGSPHGVEPNHAHHRERAGEDRNGEETCGGQVCLWWRMPRRRAAGYAESLALCV